MAYPIELNLRDRLCVLVGGGAVARRKAARLHAEGARLRIVAPVIDVELMALPGAELRQRPFCSDDLEGAFLVFAATDDAELNLVVLQQARLRGALVNMASDSQEGDFSLPALLRRGSLQVSVSTDSGSPALCVLVRDRLSASLGPEWALVAQIATALRQKLLTVQGAGPYYQQVLSKLMEADLPALVARAETDRIDQLLEQLSPGVSSLASLGIHLSNG